MIFLRKLLADERGASGIMVAVAIVIIFGFAVLTIDTSLIQLAKTQLQNAADAAALAGAIELFNTNGDQAAATAEAIRIAGLNQAVQDVQRSVVITESDVTYPGQDSITVTTHRTIVTGDPVSLYFLKVLDYSNVNLGEVTAEATASIMCLSGTDCLKPFCPPDRWDDTDNDGIWDDAEPYQDLNGNGSYDPGEPFTDENANSVWDDAEFYDPNITGYRVPDDIGDTVTFRLQDASPSLGMFWYYTVCYGPINTGDPVFTGTVSVARWISGECEPYIVRIGDWLQVEPGNFSNPTSKALDILWEQDPTAYWDEATSTVVSPYGNKSPRIIKAPAFDPTLGLQSDATGRKYLTVTRILVLFLDEPHEIVGSADLLLKGRFMKTLTEGVPDPGGCSGGGMLATSVLVK